MSCVHKTRMQMGIPNCKSRLMSWRQRLSRKTHKSQTWIKRSKGSRKSSWSSKTTGRSRLSHWWRRTFNLREVKMRRKRTWPMRSRNWTKRIRLFKDSSLQYNRRKMTSRAKSSQLMRKIGSWRTEALNPDQSRAILSRQITSQTLARPPRFKSMIILLKAQCLKISDLQSS